MKEYADLLADDPACADAGAALSAKVRDLAEFLAELGPAAPRHPLPVTVAYHDACHLGARPGDPGPAAGAAARHPRADAARRSPTPSSAAVRPASTTCSTPAGGRAGRPQGPNVLATGAELLVTANPGCLLQIAAAWPHGGHIAVAHTVEVLDASIRGRSSKN